MTRIKFATTAALLALCAPIMTSCSTASAIAGGIELVGGSQVKCPLAVEKTYYGFQAAFSGVLMSLNAGADSGLLVKGTPASIKAKSGLTLLITAKKNIDAAHQVCNASSLTGQVNAAMVLVGDLQMLAKGLAT